MQPRPSTDFKAISRFPSYLGDGSFFGTLCAIDPRPARLKPPEIVGMFRLFADLIAKHLDARRKLAAAQSALGEECAVAVLREQFIAVLAHDLRAPIRAISVFVDLLMKPPLNERAVTIAHFMRGSASRMLALIDNLLDLARGRQGGGLTLTREASEPLEPVLRTVMAELNASYPARLVEAKFSFNDPVDCDRSRIAQLFSNLLGNALIYGSANKPVRVEAFSDLQSFELSVANAGEPIPPRTFEGLFQPFYRDALMHDREGLGLGLYIAHQIAAAHGGTLIVSSTLDETRFAFRMPVIQMSERRTLVPENTPS